jgi:transcriptional regulator with XRE-family HTH domain
MSISKIEQYVIDFVRELRTSKDLTQEDIGNILGLSRSFVKNIESSNQVHKYNLTHINALADYFGMAPTDFLPAKPFPVNTLAKERNKPMARKKSPSKKDPTVRKK